MRVGDNLRHAAVSIAIKRIKISDVPTTVITLTIDDYILLQIKVLMR